MRFAWLRKHSESSTIVQQAAMHPMALIRRAYNLAFWVFLLPFFTLVEFSTGFVIFAVIIGIRLVLNLATNNAFELTPQQYENYPFRI